MKKEKKKTFEKQMTYVKDNVAIEKLQHLAEVFTIKKAILKRITDRRLYNKWRLIVEFE